MELEGADSFRIGAYRRAAARIRETPSSVAQLALDGKAKLLQDIGKTIEGKIVEVVDDGEIHALTKRKAEVPGRSGDVHAATRSRPEDGAADLEGARDHHGRRLEGGGRGAAAARPRRDRRRHRGEDRGRAGAAAGGPGAAPVAAGHDAAEASRRRRGATRASRVGRGLARRLGPADARDGARPRHHRDGDRSSGARRPLLHAAVGGRRRGEGVDEGDGRLTRRLRFDLRVVPPESYGNLLQHFTGSKNHNVALREDAVRRGFSVSEYAVTVVETGEEHRFATRGRRLSLPRLRLDPARAARGRR